MCTSPPGPAQARPANFNLAQGVERPSPGPMKRRGGDPGRQDWQPLQRFRSDAGFEVPLPATLTIDAHLPGLLSDLRGALPAAVITQVVDAIRFQGDDAALCSEALLATLEPKKQKAVLRGERTLSEFFLSTIRKDLDKAASQLRKQWEDPAGPTQMLGFAKQEAMRQDLYKCHCESFNQLASSIKAAKKRRKEEDKDPTAQTEKWTVHPLLRSLGQWCSTHLQAQKDKWLQEVDDAFNTEQAALEDKICALELATGTAQVAVTRAQQKVIAQEKDVAGSGGMKTELLAAQSENEALRVECEALEREMEYTRSVQFRTNKTNEKLERDSQRAEMDVVEYERRIKVQWSQQARVMGATIGGPTHTDPEKMSQQEHRAMIVSVPQPALVDVDTVDVDVDVDVTPDLERKPELVRVYDERLMSGGAAVDDQEGEVHGTLPHAAETAAMLPAATSANVEKGGGNYAVGNNYDDEDGDDDNDDGRQSVNSDSFRDRPTPFAGAEITRDAVTGSAGRGWGGSICVVEAPAVDLATMSVSLGAPPHSTTIVDDDHGDDSNGCGGSGSAGYYGQHPTYPGYKTDLSASARRAQWTPNRYGRIGTSIWTNPLPTPPPPRSSSKNRHHRDSATPNYGGASSGGVWRKLFIGEIEYVWVAANTAPSLAVVDAAAGADSCHKTSESTRSDATPSHTCLRRPPPPSQQRQKYPSVPQRIQSGGARAASTRRRLTTRPAAAVVEHQRQHHHHLRDGQQKAHRGRRVPLAAAHAAQTCAWRGHRPRSAQATVDSSGKMLRFNPPQAVANTHGEQCERSLRLWPSSEGYM